MATIIEQSYTVTLTLKELALIKTALSFTHPDSDWYTLANDLWKIIPVDIIHCPSMSDLAKKES